MFAWHLCMHQAVAFLVAAAGPQAGTQEGDIALRLAEVLGHLPLALAMAASYMRRCDVTCKEYLLKFQHSNARVLDRSAHRVLVPLSLTCAHSHCTCATYPPREAAKLATYPKGVAGSLSLSLSRIRAEVRAAALPGCGLGMCNTHTDTHIA